MLLSAAVAQLFILRRCEMKSDRYVVELQPNERTQSYQAILTDLEAAGLRDVFMYGGALRQALTKAAPKEKPQPILVSASFENCGSYRDKSLTNHFESVRRGVVAIIGRHPRFSDVETSYAYEDGFDDWHIETRFNHAAAEETPGYICMLNASPRRLEEVPFNLKNIRLAVGMDSAGRIAAHPEFARQFMR